MIIMNIKNFIYWIFILVGIQHINSISVIASPNESWLTLPKSKIYKEIDQDLFYEVILNPLTTGYEVDNHYNEATKTQTWGPLEKSDRLHVKILKKPGDIGIHSIDVKLLSFLSKETFKTFSVPLKGYNEFNLDIKASDFPMSSKVHLQIVVKGTNDKDYIKEYIVHSTASLKYIAKHKMRYVKFGLYQVREPIGTNGGFHLHVKTYKNKLEDELAIKQHLAVTLEELGGHGHTGGEATPAPLATRYNLLTDSHMDIRLFAVEEIRGGLVFYKSPTFEHTYSKPYNVVLTTKASSMDKREGFIEETFTKTTVYITASTSTDRWYVEGFISGVSQGSNWNHVGDQPDNGIPISGI